MRVGALIALLIFVVLAMIVVMHHGVEKSMRIHDQVIAREIEK